MRAIILALTVTVLAACGETESDPERGVDISAHGGAVETRCDVGSPPDYHVPGNPALVIGCAELRASGKRVEFSVNPQRFEGAGYVCINPAYWGRGTLGIYIPSVCSQNPIREQLEILQARVPEQAVRGYEWVVWGTVGHSATEVQAESADRVAPAALFRVDRALARDVGADEFSVFVLELPLDAACQEVTVRSIPGSAKRSELFDPRPRRPGPPRWCDEQ